MRYVITELSHVEGTADRYYAVVEYYEPDDAASPVVTEEFIFSARATGHRATRTNARGEVTATTTETIDVPAQIDRMIRGYWQRATVRGDRGDRRAKGPYAIKRDASDPQAVLARSDVQAITEVRR